MNPFEESENIEFKSSVAEWKEIIETVTAFSNTNGGKIIIGISDSGRTFGVEIGKGTIEDLTNKIINNTDPKIYPKISVKKVKEKSVIVVEVKKSFDKLVLAFGRPFKRVGKSTVRMSKEEYERIILEKHKEELRFDNQICKEANLKNIDEEKVKLFLKKARSERGLDIDTDLPVKETLLQLKLLHDRKLTNSAILLFGKNPQDFFIQAEIKCVRFKGTDVTGTMVDMKTIDGNLISQVTETEKFIFNNISMSAWIESGKIERQERWEYSPKAIRETLVNAIAHRNYRSSSKVQVRIFDDRMEFWNPGRLPEGWTVETLKQRHESKPYNPLIAKTFFWLKYVEEVGTGTNKIIQWCKEWELPEPDFDSTGTSVVITIRKSKLTDEYLDTLSINEKEKEIVNHLKVHNKITSGDIQKMFDVSRYTANMYLKRLIRLKIIKMQGKGKSIFYI